jgi:hypothetical protein
VFSITSRYGFSEEQLEGVEEGMIQALRRLNRRQSRFLKGLSPELFRMIVRGSSTERIAEDLRNIDEGKVGKFAGLQRLEEKLDGAVFVRIVSDRSVSEEDCEYLSRFLTGYEGVKLSEVKIRKLLELHASAKRFFISLSDREREVIMREFVSEAPGNRDLIACINILMIFPEYIAVLNDDQFAIAYERTAVIAIGARAFLGELRSSIKFKVIMEDAQLSFNIYKLMRFSSEYVAALDDDQFAMAYEMIVTMGGGARAFLEELRSFVKFKIIVESAQLLFNIYKLMRFSSEYIATLDDDQFAIACARIVAMTERVRSFLVELRCAGKFKVIVEDTQLLFNIYKLMRFTPEYIVTLDDEQLRILVQGSRQ